MRARQLKTGDRVAYNWGAHFPIDEGTVLGVESTWGIFSVAVRLDNGAMHYLGLGDLSTDDPDHRYRSPIGWKRVERVTP